MVHKDLKMEINIQNNKTVAKILAEMSLNYEKEILTIN